MGGGGTANGQFDCPYGIAIDTEKNVYVVDTYNSRIQKFTSDGGFITKWGSQGSGNGEFNWPKGITVDNEGNVYVADTFNNRIQKFTKEGAFITKWGSQGSGNGEFNWPKGITVDNEGNVYVADNHRIQKFTSDGGFITKWGSGGFLDDGKFVCPNGVAVDNKGHVYVADTYNHRIQKFIKIDSHIKKGIVVYPNPLRVYSPYNHTKITFGDRSEADKMLPEEGTIRIYNISGELIKDIKFNLADGGKKEWDVKNNEGKPLASGVYIYVITNPAGEKCTGKIGIVK
ncbi:MAG: SMP-30/gluconolactonase/LRE family protein [bacterium]|nr:SMP-30/gluconolactonase/LRE family protein [bacterium]